MKLTKRQLKQIIREELREANFQFPDGGAALTEASSDVDPASDPGSPSPGYENPSKGWHRLSKTEFKWLVDAIQSLQASARETDSEFQHHSRATVRRFETIESRLLANSDPKDA
ncbi:MAG: hypothetical protein CMB80_08215 [Flammeovirgaceae bacterium]|nr:hypothetical protein [Flammeovirgaceae bacterium]|tara:strand:- start:171 stop:512 length:342 start_codon:yes stop_codon:yes gene_type:complete